MGVGWALVAMVGQVVASWFLVHFLAVFGVFLAVAYPLWWLLVPKRTFCFLCRAGKEGRSCLFCRRTIKKSGGVTPVDLPSAIFNGMLILVFSAVSVGIIWGESKILFKLGVVTTPKTVSFVVPAKHQYRLGEIFPMKIEIAGIKTPINVVQADLGFESEKLEAVEVSTEGSFANIFVQKEINNEGGFVRLTGGLANPGFGAERGVFGTVFFKGKSTGVVKIEYLPSSMVLANDGGGTNVLKNLADVSYLILPERVSEEGERMQGSIGLGKDVLGDRTETQMRFYEETGGVLGAEVEGAVREEKFNLLKFLGEVVGKVDALVLEGWGRML